MEWRGMAWNAWQRSFEFASKSFGLWCNIQHCFVVHNCIISLIGRRWSENRNLFFFFRKFTFSWHFRDVDYWTRWRISCLLGASDCNCIVEWRKFSMRKQSDESLRSSLPTALSVATACCAQSDVLDHSCEKWGKKLIRKVKTIISYSCCYQTDISVESQQQLENGHRL